MARGTKEQEQTAEVAGFPYKDLMSHPAWKVIEKSISELESNSDLELRTARRHVIGYLVEKLVESGQLPPPLSQEHYGNLAWVLVSQVTSADRTPPKKLRAVPSSKKAG